MPTRPAHFIMMILYLTIPLMLLVTAIAVLPVLLGSIRHQRSLVNEGLDTSSDMADEAGAWHRMLGHRRSEGRAPHP